MCERPSSEGAEGAVERAIKGAEDAGGFAALVGAVGGAREELERKIEEYNRAVEGLREVVSGWAGELQAVEVGDTGDGAEVGRLVDELVDTGALRQDVGQAAEKVENASDKVVRVAEELGTAIEGRDEFVARMCERVEAQVRQIGSYLSTVALYPDGEGVERVQNLERALDAVLRLV